MIFHAFLDNVAIEKHMVFLRKNQYFQVLGILILISNLQTSHQNPMLIKKSPEHAIELRKNVKRARLTWRSTAYAMATKGLRP